MSGKEKKIPASHRITISGPPGSGKSTVGSMLAKRMNVYYISAGDIFRKVAKENHLSLEDLGALAEKDWDIDRYLDNQMLEKLRTHESGVFEGRLTGYLSYMNDIPSIRIYLSCSPDIRIRRIMKRENKDRKTVEREVMERERSERKRYKQIYGFDIQDLSIYHYVIDSSRMTPEEVVNRICSRL
jgi:cytidylate kinase/H/ACA ribonucleoprotein complex subunit 4